MLKEYNADMYVNVILWITDVGQCKCWELYVCCLCIHTGRSYDVAERHPASKSRCWGSTSSLLAPVETEPRDARCSRWVYDEKIYHCNCFHILGDRAINYSSHLLDCVRPQLVLRHHDTFLELLDHIAVDDNDGMIFVRHNVHLMISNIHFDG